MRRIRQVRQIGAFPVFRATLREWSASSACTIVAPSGLRAVLNPLPICSRNFSRNAPSSSAAHFIVCSERFCKSSTSPALMMGGSRWLMSTAYARRLAGEDDELFLVLGNGRNRIALSLHALQHLHQAAWCPVGWEKILRLRAVLGSCGPGRPRSSGAPMSASYSIHDVFNV